MVIIKILPNIKCISLPLPFSEEDFQPRNTSLFGSKVIPVSTEETSSLFDVENQNDLNTGNLENAQFMEKEKTNPNETFLSQFNTSDVNVIDTSKSLSEVNIEEICVGNDLFDTPREVTPERSNYGQFLMEADEIKSNSSVSTIEYDLAEENKVNTTKQNKSKLGGIQLDYTLIGKEPSKRGCTLKSISPAKKKDQRKTSKKTTPLRCLDLPVASTRSKILSWNFSIPDCKAPGDIVSCCIIQKSFFPVKFKITCNHVLLSF